MLKASKIFKFYNHANDIWYQTESGAQTEFIKRGEGKFFFFKLYIQGHIPGCWFFFSKRFRVVSDKIGHKLQILSET